MYLSRLFLNPRSRQVQREIARPYEMHRTMMRAFPDYISDAERVLFRLEIQPRSGMPVVLVQSVLLPHWDYLQRPGSSYLLELQNCPAGVTENPQLKTFELRLGRGQNLLFRLRGNPTVKKDREGEKQGRRVGLYREEEQLGWLKRKLEDAGAELVSARLSSDSKVDLQLYVENILHKTELLSVQFDGVLTVRTPEKLVQAIQSGIGPAKGFGFGLLSLAPLKG